MVTLIRLIAGFIMVLGLTYSFRQDLLEKAIRFWCTGKRLQVAAGARIVFGTILLAGAGVTRVPVVFYTVGTMALAAGVFIFMKGAEASAKQLLTFYNEKRTWMPVLAMIASGVGVLLLLAS